MRFHAGIWATAAVLFLAQPGGSRGDPNKETEPERIARFIRQLGDDAFERREAAGEALAAIGEPALAALRKAAADPDPEVRQRAEGVLKAIADRATKEALGKLQGAWSLVSYDADGNRVKGEDKGHVFIFKGERWTIQVGGQLFQGGTVQRIEAKGNYNEIDLFITEGGNVGSTAVSIIAVEGDSLRYLNCGTPRATEFVTKLGDGRHFLTFRQVKP